MRIGRREPRLPVNGPGRRPTGHAVKARVGSIRSTCNVNAGVTDPDRASKDAKGTQGSVVAHCAPALQTLCGIVQPCLEPWASKVTDARAVVQRVITRIVASTRHSLATVSPDRSRDDLSGS